MGVFLFFLSLVVCIFLAFIFLPRTLGFLASLLGYYLRRSSQTRRELLVARNAEEVRRWEAGRGDETEEEDGWEEIEGSLVGSAVNGGKADKDWHGIVGFFHPFW
jgi:alpha-1,2-mannosyltransferase